MRDEKKSAPAFSFLTTGVVKEDAYDKGPKIQVNHCKGPGVVRNRVATPKPTVLKPAKDDAEYGLGPGVVKKGKK